MGGYSGATPAPDGQRPEAAREEISSMRYADYSISAEAQGQENLGGPAGSEHYRNTTVGEQLCFAGPGEAESNRETAKRDNMTEKEKYGWNQEMGLPLLAKMRADLKEAMRSQDTVVKDAIRITMAEFPKLTVPLTLESGKKSSRPKKPEEITDDEIIGIIQGLVKSEKQTLELIGRPSSEYLEILQNYLPRQASREEIETWIRENIDFSQFKNPLQATGVIMKHFGKKADGNQVRQILEEKRVGG